jgi:signal transduction histidine kinase
VRFARTDDGMAKVTVADTGVGIAQEMQASIFSRFYRIDKSRSRRDGGVGLGLAIVKELTEAMGGKVSVVSAPGEGSAFTLALPAAPAMEDGQPPARATARPSLSVQ